MKNRAEHDSRGRLSYMTMPGRRMRRVLAWCFVFVAMASLLGPVFGQTVDFPRTLLGQDEPAANANPHVPANQPMSLPAEAVESLSAGPAKWTSPEGLGSSLQMMLLLTVLSLAPAVLLMTTSFVRIVVVLGLLRQALGTQQLPPTQVITSLAMFLSLLIMTPVWKQVYDDAIVPYTHEEISLEEAWTAGVGPIRRFMIAQIEATGNTDDIYLFLDYAAANDADASQGTAGLAEIAHDDVPLQALLPAFLLSELKTAFLIGFQIYLPFLIIDMVVAGVMVSMGMIMLPPVLVSLPFKLLLFVLLDGWRLVVGMLLNSFQTFT
ncbi:MAG: flagellar type III secretion system pore protein FliP [Pirellulaceae bacterium]|nr:flagellar type III secretion system pore protein FliP [Pirellulaceae bacterium]